ncbi:hypothetical protein LC087_14065 [Bacillus carboniphilus]|uniref:Polysaccharide biosynthesis protein n=1 Tax=Bacillus carboniphilus TaxID=86663 RepID=A0ABY9JRA2_9BACI|nr:hypothetical protein [Bacillus carboniphilus]WLR41931.1 hypothetical protein LC087_14065 [Bacillus carboniphilus]
MLIFIQLVDSFTLYSSMIDFGMNQDAAKELKGVYDRGQPLLQLGTVLSTSLSLTLVPLIARAVYKGDKQFIRDSIHNTLKTSIVISIAATIGLMAIMESTNIMLFRNNRGTDVLTIFCLSIFFTGISMTVTGILQGLGGNEMAGCKYLNRNCCEAFL